MAEKKAKNVHEILITIDGEEWNKIHPEISYTDYLKQEAEKNHRRFDYMNAMLGEPHPVYSTYFIKNLN